MTITIGEKEQIAMRLMHYFITVLDYTPIVVRGVNNEVWLENNEANYKIVRINSNYIHNEEQFKFDMLKIKNVVKQIKRKTISFKMKTFNIFLDVNEDLKINNNENVVNLVLRNDSKKELLKLDSYFPDFSKKIIKDASGLELITNVTEGINEKTIKSNRKYENIFKPKPIVITYILMGICIFMYLLTLTIGGSSDNAYALLKLGAVYSPLIKAGQIYRLITGTFLHAGILHLICNMYSLYIIGSQMENFIGKKKFIFIYLISAISGSLMSSVFSSAVSVGASGAIFGLLGAMLYFGYTYRTYLSSVMTRQIIPIIILNLFLGFSLSGIDNFAHIGGLVGGYLAMMAIGIEEDSKFSEKINGFVVLLGFLGFLTFMLFR